MSTTWYAKIDCNFHANRKAIKAGRLGREVYVFILCVNAQKGALGVVPTEDLEPWYVASQLQMCEIDAQHGLELCVKAGLIEIDDGLISISGWTDEYGKYPLKSADKQKAYRERLKNRKPKHESVTTVTDHGNAGSNGVTPVTQVGRKEGREGESVPAPPIAGQTNWSDGFSKDDDRSRGRLAELVWAELSRRRIAVAAELRIDTLPLAVIVPSREPVGFRDLRERIGEEGDAAPAICLHVLEVLTSEARKSKSIEWLADKSFGGKAWRNARSRTPSWRGSAPVVRTDEDSPAAEPAWMPALEAHT